ncbi:DNA excision repair protein ERCC-6-like [Zophobas morio]|uniref:DNA excision repair protein ERCC-6-like n=1 Tax=Zophobas morio TaxID=2755281 RepID=UPI0030832452
MDEQSYEECISHSDVVKAKNMNQLNFSESNKHKTFDDGDDNFYMNRLNRWLKDRCSNRLAHSDADFLCKEQLHGEELLEEEFLDGGDKDFITGEFKVPGSIWKRLFRHQKVCVKWLWELFQQRVGGIIGDEMGLGKTIEVIAFLAALKYSKIGRKWPRHPHKGFNLALLVCPATIMTQWVKEFHKWWPPFRVK